MAVARFAVDRPAANTDTLLFTIERTALASLVAVNTSGFTNISAWIVPAGEDANPDNWIYYVDNIGLTNRNTFETFRVAVNVDDKIYVRSTSGEVTFFINGIYDVAGRANVTTGPQEPESPQIGDVWINEAADPKEIFYWDGTIWMPLGITGPANELTVGTVTTSDPGSDAEVTITGDSPEQTINFVLPRGVQGPGNTLTVGTVSASAPGEDPEVEITGTSPDQTINFVLPRGDVGPEGPQGPDGLPDKTGNEGKFLTNDGVDAYWETVDAFPDQTDNAGKYLSTDGTAPFWEELDALPDQADNGGKYLTTDGTDASWAFISGGSAADEPPAEPQDGTIWLDTDGTIYPTSVEIRRWTKTVSSSITEFTGAGDETEDLEYEPGTEQVYLNGVALIRGTDYTASSGTSINLATAAVSGDVLQVILLPPVVVANVINNNVFDAKGDILTATADNTPINLAVGANGTFLKADDSTPSGLVWAPVDVAAIEDNYVLALMGAI